MNLSEKRWLTNPLFSGLLLIAAVMLLISCDGAGNGYAEYRNLPPEGWRYGDTLQFTPVHHDSICSGRLAVGIRHGYDYPYASLWLETTVEDGGHRRTDTIEMRLADRFGSWTGRGIGASFQAVDTVALPFLHRSGSPIKVRHIMRRDTLPAIQQLGIFFID